VRVSAASLAVALGFFFGTATGTVHLSGKANAAYKLDAASHRSPTLAAV
jgi:hypothetical protein